MRKGGQCVAKRIPGGEQAFQRQIGEFRQHAERIAELAATRAKDGLLVDDQGCQIQRRAAVTVVLSTMVPRGRRGPGLRLCHDAPGGIDHQIGARRGVVQVREGLELAPCRHGQLGGMMADQRDVRKNRMEYPGAQDPQTTIAQDNRAFGAARCVCSRISQAAASGSVSTARSLVNAGGTGSRLATGKRQYSAMHPS